jgi:hypothetical protein
VRLAPYYRGICEARGGSMLQLYALAILHMDKTGGFPFSVITDGFPLIDKIGGKAGKYFSIHSRIFDNLLELFIYTWNGLFMFLFFL